MSAHGSPDGHEAYPGPSHPQIDDEERLNDFLRAINMQGALAEGVFADQPSSTTPSQPIQIPLPDPPVIVPSQPLPAFENQPIYLQSAYPDPPPPQPEDYSHIDYNAGHWQHHSSPGTIQTSITNSPHGQEQHWQTAHPQAHAEPALRRSSGEYHSPHYQTTPSPVAALSPLPLTPGGVSRSSNSRGQRAAHTAPYDLSSRRVSNPSAYRPAEDVSQHTARTPSPTRMPPPVSVPQRSTPSTKKRSRAVTGGEATSGRTKKGASQPSHLSIGGSRPQFPPQLQLSGPGTTSPTIPSYASHSPVQSSPLVSAPVILPHETLSPATVPRQVSPARSSPVAVGAGVSSPASSHYPAAAESLLMSTHATTQTAAISSFSSSSGSTSSSAIPSSLSSSLSGSTSASSVPQGITIETHSDTQQIQIRPQRPSQRSQLRQPSASATSAHRAPYPQTVNARLAYSQATKSARAHYLRQYIAPRFLVPEELLPSTDPSVPRISHPVHHPLAPWLTTDINTADHIPADMRYDAESHTLCAVLALPGIEKENIAITLEDVHFNRNRVLFVSAFMPSTFPWPEDDLRASTHAEAVQDLAAEQEESSASVTSSKGKDRDDTASTENAQDPPSTSNENPSTQPTTCDTPASQPARMAYNPNIRELIYGRQVRVINVPPSTQPKDVTVTLIRGLLYIKVDMGEPLTRETAYRNSIPILAPTAGVPSRPYDAAGAA